MKTIRNMLDAPLAKEFVLGGVAARDMVSLCPPHLLPHEFAALPEGQRLAEIKAAAASPDVCGPDIPVAPARGDLGTFRPIELVPGTVGVARHTGHWERGEPVRRQGARIRDVFDRIRDAARRAHEARGDKAGRFVPPLTPAQEQIGRDYRNMVERHSAAGVKCASLESAGRSGGNGGDFLKAYLDESERIAALRRRIGDGAALQVRRIRPSRRGSRATISDRQIVDSICLGDMDPAAVLGRFGWSVHVKALDALRAALSGALDRMIGYDPQKGA